MMFNLLIGEAYCVIIALHFTFFCCRRTIPCQAGFCTVQNSSASIKVVIKCLEACGKITRSGRSGTLMPLLKTIHHGGSGSPKEVVRHK